MPSKRVLIVGGGIAGPVLAYWLAKSSYTVTILERSPHISQAGQVIDIEGPSQEIMSRMNLLASIQAEATHEAGIAFVDGRGRVFGQFPAGSESAGVSKDVEIMRPRLGRLLWEAARGEGVVMRFGCTVKEVQQRDQGVRVDVYDMTKDETTSEDYDVLVAADGLRSKTRDMVMPKEVIKDCVKSLGVFVAFFEVPAKPEDAPYSKAHNEPGSRSVFIKPIDKEISSAYLGVAQWDQELHEARESRDMQRQKSVLAERFKGMGWETDRLVKGMLEADNFYFEEISQVKMDKWSNGRCVLLGDTAWCPSPMTGQGTNSAIVGAYFLANSMVKHGDDVEAAFEEYERELRPFIEKIQWIPFGGRLPKIINPKTWVGIGVQRVLIWLVSSLKVYKLFPTPKRGDMTLPDL